MTENRSLILQLQQLDVELVTYRALQDLNPRANANSLIMVLRYCRAAGLDPLRSPVVVLPIDGKQVPVLSINGLRAHAMRTGAYAGGRLEYCGQSSDVDGLQLPRWCKFVVIRVMPTGSLAEFDGQVFASEAVGRTKDGKITKIWRSRGRHMLGIAAERLALRRAFPESVPPADVVEGHNHIDPNTGESYGPTPQHLSDEDIAAGLDSIEAIDAGASEGDWLDAYGS